jgi:ferredoxin
MDEPQSARVSIDHGMCSGHDQCSRLAPEIFDIDDDGFGRVRETGFVAVSDALAEAVALCPEQAITLEYEVNVQRPSDREPAFTESDAGVAACQPADPA